MNIHLLRHATIILTIAGFDILVDPMLGAARSYDAIANTENQQRNPLVDLPFDDKTLSEHLAGIDSVVVTHLHNDHWDARARETISKSLPVFCQPEDTLRIQEAGFQSVQPVGEDVEWNGLRITRTGGQHGRGKIGELMAPVSGFVLNTSNEPTVYIAGDTVWCEDVQEAIDLYRPDVIIVNAGAAQFTSGGPITMTTDHIIAVSNAAPNAIVIAVHMEAINHCLLSRGELNEALTEADIASRVRVPKDGEQIIIEITDSTK